MGVEWPDRREDVLNALDILASSDPSAEWPTLTEAVHWLVDDTFWDVRDPKEDIGALLVDEQEAAAIRSVVSAVMAVSERQGPTASDQAWLDDSGWPMVRNLAARAATALRGFVGDAVGRRLRAVERLAWTDPDGSSDPRVGPTHLHFDGGVGLFLSGATDWCLDVDLTRAGDESWLVSYNYVDPAGRWTLRDASSEEPFSGLVGRRLESCAAITRYGDVDDVSCLHSDPPAVQETLADDLETVGTVVCAHAFGIGVYLAQEDAWGHVDLPALTPGDDGKIAVPSIGAHLPLGVLVYSGTGQLRLAQR